MKHFFNGRLISKVIMSVVSVLCLAGGLICYADQTVSYSNDRISITAENEPMVPLLEKIAVEANIVIFISKGFTSDNLSIHAVDQPLEKALDRLLKGLNVVKIYHAQSDKPRLTAVKIYPKGKISGPLDVVVKSSIPEPQISFSHQEKKYASLENDALNPQDYVGTVEYDSLASTAMAFEKREIDSWQNIQLLKEQINDEVDETKNEVLSLALMDKYEDFKNLQKNHIDTLEKMHRMEHFMESKAGKDNKKEF